MQTSCQTLIKHKISYLFVVLVGLFLTLSGGRVQAQCNGTISNGGTISASVSSGNAPLTVTFNNTASPSGNCGWCGMDVMFVIIENGNYSYYYPNTLSYTYTFYSAGNMEIYRCTRYTGCSNWEGETNHLYIAVGGGCSNVTDGGSIGVDETLCNTNANPANIYNISYPSGGTGNLEYVWLQSNDGGNNYSVISGASGDSYDPGVITQTTWYRRCARRSGCTSYIGESNWVKKEVTSCANCSCPGNLVQNNSFENGTTSWNWSGGNLYMGTGGVACGSYSGDFQITNASSNWVSQELNLTSYAAGGTFNISVYAGTHDNSFDNYVAINYFDANWNWISGSFQQVDKILSNAPAGPQLYSWTSTMPTGISHVTVSFGGTGSWTKTDNWCVTYTPAAVCNPNDNTASTGFCAPAPTCAGGKFLWSQSIDVSNGNPSLFKLISGSVNTYTLNSGFPVAFSGNVNISVDQVVSYDGYSTRNTVTQTNERWRLVFKKNGSVVYATPYTNDVPDLVKQGYWSGALGTTFNAPNGIDQIVFEHIDVANGYVSPGSVIPTSICLNYTAVVCDNVTDGGVVGYNETICGTSFDPSNIVNVTLPSGGTGTLEYIWLMTTDAATVAGNAQNYTVIPNSTGASYDPGVISQTTWYRRCARRSGCTSYIGETAWIKKEICPNPTANAGTDKNINCTTTSVIIGTAAISGNTYNWSPATGLSSTSNAQPTANPTTTTTYTVTVTNSCGCTATDIVVVNVDNSVPTADAGVDKNLNCTTTSTTIGTTGIVGNGYYWTPATGLSSQWVYAPTATPTVTTTYTLTVTAPNGCTATDVVTVNVNTTLPTANAGPDRALNCTTTSATLGTAAISGYSYSWAPATGLSSATAAQPTANPSSTTTYTLTVTGPNGCKEADEVIVTVNTSVPVANAGPDKNLNCTTTSTTIGTAAVSGYSYSWTPSTGLSSTVAAQPTANPSSTTTYTVVVTGSNGCTASDIVIVNVNTSVPNVDAGPDKNLNCSITSTTIGTTAISGYTYDWNPSTGLSASNIAQPTANPTVSTTYTLTVTGANGCIASDVVTVNVNKSIPVADAGFDKNLNCTTTSTIIGTTAISGNTYSWSPATGLSSTSVAQPTANPSTTTTYTVTVTGANGCSASDVVTVNVNTTIPNADAGIDKNITCSIASVTIGTSGIVGNSYSWSPSTGLNSTILPQPTATPTVTTTYTVTVTNAASGCTSTDEVTVNVDKTAPIANAGPNKNLNCTTTSTTIGTTAISGYTYSWSPSTGLSSTTVAQPTASPTTSRTYTITVTGSNGCTASDVVTVNVNTTTPTADAGVDKNLNCTTTSTTIGTTAISGNTYSWSPAAGLSSTTVAQPTANPTITTIYTVTVTGSNGCTASDVVTVNVNTTTPTANAGVDKNLNCTTTSTTIGTIGLVGNSYSWTPATGLSSTTVAQPTANPTTSTTYTITATGSNGCTASDVVTVNVNTTTPTADAGPDKNLDCNTTSVMIGTTAISGNTYSWSPATGLSSTTVAQPTANPTTTTTYTVTVTGSNGCTASDVVTVNVNTSAPLANAGPNKNLNCTTTSTTIGTTAISGNTYSWSPATGLSSTTVAQPTANPTTSTTYIVTVTGSNGCTASDVVTVNVNTTTPTVDAGPDKNLDCNTTSAMIGTNAIAGNTYSWSPATGLSSITVAQPTANPTTTTTYTVTVTGSNGCTASDVVTVNVNTSAPLANAGPNKNLNCTTTSTTIGTTAISGNTYSWSPATGLSSTTVAQPTANPTTTTTYTVTVTGSNGCTASDVVTVNVNTTTPTADAGPDKNLDCNTTSAMIGTNAIAGNTYVWSNGITTATQTVNPTNTTTYTVTVTGSNGCTASDVVTVNVNTTSPTVDAGPDKNLDCNTTSAMIGTNAIVGNTYSWSPATGLSSTTVAQPTANPTTTTTYTVTVTGSNGCTASDVVTVNVNTVTPTADAGPDKNLDCNTTSAMIGTNAIAGNTYVWSNGITTATQTVNPTITTTYTVTVTGSNGCTASDVVTVNVNQIPPVASITGNMVVCNGSTTVLTANGNGSILWNTGATTTDITVGAGTYTVTITDGVCASTSTVTVENKQGTIGNYVWMDNNVNGIQDDGVASGINGVVVELWTPGADNQIGGGDDALLQTTTTNNNNNGNSGYYQFVVCNSGNYYVKFPTNIGKNVLTAVNQTPATDLNSDASVQGNSPIFAIDINGSGVAKDNHTIDAGYMVLKYIGNRVWFDNNQNGLQDPSEVGVSRITVSLLDNTGKQVASTITDAYGYYLFNDMIGGDYSIAFTLPAGYVFTTKDAGSDNEIDSDVNPSTGVTDIFTYVSGTINLSYDAGIYLPIPGIAKIGDKVWNDTDRDGIQDPTEVGVASVTVSLYDNNNNLVSTTITNADGEYLFDRVAPGTYYVKFTQPIGYVITTPLAGNNDTEDSNPDPSTGATQSFVVNAGDYIRTIDAGIYPQNTTLGSIGNFVWNDVNNNGIQDPYEAGISGVVVTLYNETGTTPIAVTTTDKFGNYIFNGLPANNYIVEFTNLPSGFQFVAANAGNDDVIDSDPNVVTGRTAVITLLAGQVNTTVDAGLYNPSLPTAALGNYVWYDRNADGIQDANENGVPGVTVNLYTNNNVLINKTATDIEGKYIFNNLDAGTYYVNFSNLPAGFKLTAPNQGSRDDADSDADQGTQNTDLVTLLASEVNLTIDAGLVTNDRREFTALGDLVWNDANNNGIQDIGELGVQGVTVTLYQSNGTSILATTTTNSLGEYIFNNLEEGSYVVGFSNLPAGYAFSSAKQGNDIEVDSDVDATTNGKTAIIYLPAGEFNNTIDAGIHPNPGFASIGDLVWSDINQNGIQDAGEPGIPGVTVILYNINNEPVGNTTSDANGNYQFTGLVPGSYSVGFSNLPANYNFTTPNANANSQDNADSDVDPNTGRSPIITVAADEYNTTVDAGIFTLKASLGNYVWEDYNYNGLQDANEAGLSGVTVTLYDVNNTPVTMAITDARGQYNFVNLEPGTYHIGISNIPNAAIITRNNVGTNDAIDSDIDPTTSMSAPVTLAIGEYNPTLDAGIHLLTGAGLGDYVWLDLNSNNVQDPTETGLSGVTVTLYGENGNPIKSTVTDQTGAYTFANLTPGTYSVGFSTLPILYKPDGAKCVTYFVLPNVGNDAFDSDVDPSTGRTPQYTIAPGEYNPTLDAGLKFGFVLPADKLEATSAIYSNENSVVVNFKTLSEDNTRLFEIERSIDGIHFEQVGTTNAAGHSVGYKYYAYTDDVSGIDKQQTIYYRVKLVDIDGQFAVSNIVTAKTIDATDEVLVFPTLFNDVVNVVYQSQNTSSIHITISDMNGNVVATQDADVTIGKNIVSVNNLSMLANGMYMIRVFDLDNSAKYVFRIQKQNN